MPIEPQISWGRRKCTNIENKEQARTLPVPGHWAVPPVPPWRAQCGATDTDIFCFDGPCDGSVMPLDRQDDTIVQVYRCA